MAAWTSDELDKIGRADELDVITLRGDGTSRKPVTIWVVRHEDGLYVRAGGAGAWFRAARARRQGRIQAGGVNREVAFVDAASALNDKIDDAYRKKYACYGAKWIDMVVAPLARSTTIKVVPQP
jgi:hypothetical protein